jgi:drug/metabolite transporter (DMT)-like permease
MALSDNLRGAALMVGAMTCFTVNDAFMKALGQGHPLFQIMFLRGVGASLFLIILAIAMGHWRRQVAPRDRRLMGIRAVAEMVGAWTFITAVIAMPFAEVNAILQVLPLVITLAGAVFLGERVGWRRMAAIIVGFGGVMLIVRPGSAAFSPYALLVLGCVLAVTVRDLSSRKMSADLPTLMVAATSAVGVMIFAGVGSLFVDWQPMSVTHLGQLAGAVLFLIGGYACSVAAVRVGDLSFVAPFRYSGLVVALVLGFVVFGTFPDGWTLVGAAIVVATGLYTLWREAIRRRGPKDAPEVVLTAPATPPIARPSGAGGKPLPHRSA